MRLPTGTLGTPPTDWESRGTTCHQTSAQHLTPGETRSQRRKESRALSNCRARGVTQGAARGSQHPAAPHPTPRQGRLLWGDCQFSAGRQLSTKGAIKDGPCSRGLSLGSGTGPCPRVFWAAAGGSQCERHLGSATQRTGLCFLQRLQPRAPALRPGELQPLHPAPGRRSRAGDPPQLKPGLRPSSLPDAPTGQLCSQGLRQPCEPAQEGLVRPPHLLPEGSCAVTWRGLCSAAEPWHGLEEKKGTFPYLHLFLHL